MRVRLRGALVAKAYRLAQTGAVRAALRTSVASAWTRGAIWRRPRLSFASTWRDRIAERFDPLPSEDESAENQRPAAAQREPTTGRSAARKSRPRPGRVARGQADHAARRTAAEASAQPKGFEPGSRPRLQALASVRRQAGPILATRQQAAAEVARTGPPVGPVASIRRTTGAAELVKWLRSATAAASRKRQALQIQPNAASAPGMRNFPTPSAERTPAELGLKIAAGVAETLRRQAGTAIAESAWESTASSLAALWSKPLGGSEAAPELLRAALSGRASGPDVSPSRPGIDAGPPRRDGNGRDQATPRPSAHGESSATNPRRRPNRPDPAGPPPLPHDGALMLRPEIPNLHPTGLPTSDTMPAPDAAVGVVRGSRDSFSRVQPPQGAPSLPPLIPDRVSRPPSYGVGAVLLRQGARAEEADTEGMEALAERIRRIMCEDARRHGLNV